MSKKPFIPFANESDELEIGEMAIENRLDRVSLHGDIDLSKDQKGSANARLLQKLLDDVVTQLEAVDLPEHFAVASARTVSNPFGIDR